MTLEKFDLVIFGGNGDLSMRKLLPAMYARDRAGDLPLDARILCIGRHVGTNNDFLESVEKGFKENLKQEMLDTAVWDRFCKKISYISMDATSQSSYATLAKKVRSSTQGVNTVFYLATPPSLFSKICSNLAAAGLVTATSRVVLEKPLGRDLASAKKINSEVGEIFSESQIFRIDHYLGKETVQNLIALRFGNILFEPLWRREWISDVQITIAEKMGVGNRMGYYETAGALRDMLQNHLLQLLCIVAMEPPASITADAVRDEKLKVLRSLKRFNRETLEKNVVRGQYHSGEIGGTPVEGYRQESHNSSCVETFVALKAEVDTWRWAGVPFYLRTGKRMAHQMAEVVIRFKDIPHSIFPQTNGFEPNCLVIRLQPEESLTMDLMAKVPGDGMRLRPVELGLNFQEKINVPHIEAYERLLVDILRGQLTLFMRSDELEAAWEWVEPILDSWGQGENSLRPYTAGTWGPAESSELIGRDGLKWHEEMTSTSA